MNKNEEIRKDKKVGVRFESAKGLKKYVFGDNIDELIDGLELLKDGKIVNEFMIEFPDLSGAQLKRLDVLMTKTTNANEIVRYAINRQKLSNKEDIKEADLLKMKKAIFKTENFFDIIEFCHYFQKNSNIITQEDVQKVEKLAIDSKKAFYARLCASDVNGVNIEKLQEIVIESNDPVVIYDFAKKVEGADIEKLRLAIEKTKDTDWIKMFIKSFCPILNNPNPNKKKRSFFKK